MTQWRRANANVPTEEPFNPSLIKMDEFKPIGVLYVGMSVCVHTRVRWEDDGHDWREEKAGGIPAVWSRFPFLLWSQGRHTHKANI